MRNKLTFSNMAFLMLLVGKIGHLGTLGGLSWLIVFIPLALDVFFDFTARMGYLDQAIGWINMKKKIRDLNNIANDKTGSNG